MSPMKRSGYRDYADRRAQTCDRRPYLLDDGWLRGVDLNHRPLGYEPNELPDCSTPRFDDSNPSRVASNLAVDKSFAESHKGSRRSASGSMKVQTRCFAARECDARASTIRRYCFS